MKSFSMASMMRCINASMLTEWCRLKREDDMIDELDKFLQLVFDDHVTSRQLNLDATFFLCSIPVAFGQNTTMELGEWKLFA